MRRALDIQPGDAVIFEIENGRLLLSPVKQPALSNLQQGAPALESPSHTDESAQDSE
jgi:bifunctional DNA-binding transcriptional regulator/antitoxin component of YhaV-PrlF toxin-antitoxin module